MKRALVILSVLLFVSLWFNAWQLSMRMIEHGETSVHVDTVWHDVYVPRDSVVLRYETVRLARAYKPAKVTKNVVDSVQAVQADSVAGDSVDAVIPISQSTFESEDWKIWVSGYRVSLDSTETYRRTVTIEKPTVKRRRWAFGPQLGVGVGKNGVQPYFGIGGTYDILP